jgi:hypothetical protein
MAPNCKTRSSIEVVCLVLLFPDTLLSPAGEQTVLSPLVQRHPAHGTLLDKASSTIASCCLAVVVVLLA